MKSRPLTMTCSVRRMKLFEACQALVALTVQSNGSSRPRLARLQPVEAEYPVKSERRPTSVFMCTTNLPKYEKSC